MTAIVIDDILRNVRLRGVIYFHTHFTPPWGVRVPRYGRVARFHICTSGHAHARVGDSGETIRLEQGDAIMIAHGESHVLSDDPETPPILLDNVMNETGLTSDGALVYGGDDSPDPCRLVCGHFEFDENIDHPFLQALPSHIVIRGESAVDYSWINAAGRHAMAEIRDGRPGMQAIALRLSEIIFIQVLRSFLEHDAPTDGFFAGLSDRHIGRALAAIHAEPARAWTVGRLAREAGLSRTQFAERFRQHVGAPPLAYVTEWRMHRARRLLVDTDVNLASIAAVAGYRSATAFGRAFKRAFGVGPGAYREARRNGADAPAA